MSVLPTYAAFTSGSAVGAVYSAGSRGLLVISWFTRPTSYQLVLQVTTLEQKVASIEKSINELTIRARELGSQNNNLMTERDELQEKAAGIAAHVKALQAFKKNCQSFLDCRDDLPDVPITPEPPSAYRVPRYRLTAAAGGTSPSGSRRASNASRPSRNRSHLDTARSHQSSRHSTAADRQLPAGSRSARNSQPASRGSNYFDDENK